MLGRDRARLEVVTNGSESIVELSARHAEILLMLATHRQGLSAEHLAELVYGEGASPDTLRPEMVRLRKALERVSPELVPQSRPYRLSVAMETDAQNVLSLLDRGAHRVALSAYRGPVLPNSDAPGVVELREGVRGTLRETMRTEVSVDVLLAYADIPEGARMPRCSGCAWRCCLRARRDGADWSAGSRSSRADERRARSRFSVSASAALSGIRASDRCSGCRFLQRMWDARMRGCGMHGCGDVGCTDAADATRCNLAHSLATSPSISSSHR